MVFHTFLLFSQALININKNKLFLKNIIFSLHFEFCFLNLNFSSYFLKK